MIVAKDYTENSSETRPPEFFKAGEPTSEYTGIMETRPEFPDRKLGLKDFQRVLPVFTPEVMV
jgi:hypothetical protein